MSEKLKNGIKILVSQAVLELLFKTIVVMFWSKTQEPPWYIEILMLFLSFSDNLLQDVYINFQEGVDNSEIAHKTRSILVRGAVSPKCILQQNKVIQFAAHNQRKLNSLSE